MKNMVLALLLGLFAAGLVAPQIAQAAKICTITYVGGESKGHKTTRLAKAGAWLDWQTEMRKKYGRKFSLSLVRSMPGYPKTSKDGRFNHSARVSAQGCYVKGVSCVTGTGITPTCECQGSFNAAKSQGCKVYRAGR